MYREIPHSTKKKKKKPLLQVSKSIFLSHPSLTQYIYFYTIQYPSQIPDTILSFTSSSWIEFLVFLVHTNQMPICL